MGENRDFCLTEELDRQRKAQKTEKKTGYIHVYCGDGKGKTTCGMGLCMRAAGYGYQVLIYQFMKDNSTNERSVLEQLPNVTFVDGLSSEKFSFQMTEEEKQERKSYYEKQFRKLTNMARDAQVLFLDEILYTVRAGLFDEQMLLDFLNEKPAELEVILTGQGLSDALYEHADYITEMCKIKHPYDRGVAARDGIER